VEALFVMFSTLPWRVWRSLLALKGLLTPGLLIAFSSVLWLACSVGSSADGDDQAASNLGQQLVDEARELYRLQEAEFFAGHVQLWGVNIWSWRWMEAERKLAPNSPQARNAERAHVDRVRSIDKWIKEEAAAGRGWMERYVESDFYRVAAEAMLSGRETEKPKTTMGADPALIRLAAARLIYGDVWTKLQNLQGGPFSVVADWSLAVREAEMELRTDNLSRRAAAEAHLKRMRDLEETARQLFEAKKTVSHDFAQTTFYRADAEVFVTELMDPSHSTEQRRAEAAKLRVDSAKALYQGVWEEFLERRIYPEFIYERSMQWRNAVIAVAKNKVDRISASEAHLTRMKELNKVFKEKYDGLPARHLLACEYYRTEAQVLFQEAKAK
jgi:hypothetical protein